MSEVKMVQLDPKYEGPQKRCLACGGFDLRVTYPLGSAFVWCVDCIRGWHVGGDRPFDVAGLDDFLEQSLTIRTLRRQDLADLKENMAILEAENKKFKEALELVATHCLIKFQVFESTDDTQDILDTVCYALGLDYDTEVEKAEAKGRKEQEEEYESTDETDLDSD